MSFEIHAGSKRALTLEFSAPDGSPGRVDGFPLWSIQPPGVGMLVTADDGMSAELSWMSEGEATVIVTADGDLGEGFFPITVQETFTFLAAPLGANAGVLNVGPETGV